MGNYSTPGDTSMCVPSPKVFPRAGAIPAVIVIVVVIMAAVSLAVAGLPTDAVGSLLAASAAAAGYLVRQLRGQVNQ